MYLTLCWQNRSHAGEDTKFISSCVNQNHPKPAHTKNASHLVTTNPTQVSEDIKSIQSHTMPARTQNVPLHVMTKPIRCQRVHKKYLNLCWQNKSHASEDTKCISTCVEPTLHMPMISKNIFQHVLTKPSDASTCSNTSQHVLTKPHPYKRGN